MYDVSEHPMMKAIEQTHNQRDVETDEMPKRLNEAWTELAWAKYHRQNDDLDAALRAQMCAFYTLLNFLDSQYSPSDVE